jgi:hypothetical protein
MRAQKQRPKKDEGRLDAALFLYCLACSTRAMDMNLLCQITAVKTIKPRYGSNGARERRRSLLPHRMGENGWKNEASPVIDEWMEMDG